MGLPGKPKGFDGSEVERYFHENWSRRSPTTARPTLSIRTGCGCGTSSFDSVAVCRGREDLPRSYRLL